MNAPQILGLLLIAAVVIGYPLHRRAVRKGRDVALIDGYTHVARCVCGWEIGADSPEDAALMLALHEVVTLNTAMEAS
jgi:hypothetical protein